MECFVVTQSFFNPIVGAEGKLGEYLEMSKADGARLAGYVKPVSKGQREALKERRVVPRVVTLMPCATPAPEKAPSKKQMSEAAANKIQRLGKNK